LNRSFVPAKAGTQRFCQRTWLPLSRERTEFVSAQYNRALATMRSYESAGRQLHDALVRSGLLRGDPETDASPPNQLFPVLTVREEYFHS